MRQEQLAEDVTQGVFVLLAQKAHTLADGAFLAGWLHKATRYACANALRTENRRRKLETKAARMKNTLVEDTATLSEGDWKQLSPALDDALGRLARKDRDLLLMRYFESLETADLAVRMGISEEAARKRLSRAIDRLREVLERRGMSASNLTLAGLMGAAFRAAGAGAFDRDGGFGLAGRRVESGGGACNGDGVFNVRREGDIGGVNRGGGRGDGRWGRSDRSFDFGASCSPRGDG